MLIYEEGDRHDDGYKRPSRDNFDFIHSRTVGIKRPPITQLRKLTRENCEFLRRIGLTLKKC